jgi:intein/homing endonuclease
MPSNWLVFDRIRALTKNFNIYPVERIFSNQSNLDKLTAGGEFLDFNQSAAILDQTNLQINRLERYKDYEQMDQTGEISLALDLYADEASLVDPEVKHTLVIKAKTRRIKKELEELFYNVLHWDNQLRPTVRYLCKYGDLPFEVILDANRTGVTALKFMSVYNFTRIETRYGDLVGFFYSDPLWSKPMFLHPWQVMHLRLTSFENLYSPYGRCADINSRVWGPAGSKPMKDLQPNDEVYSFDGTKIVPTRVVKFVSNGVKPTLLIKTKHRAIRVTDNHPMLAVVKNRYTTTKFGAKRDLTTKQYVSAGDLVIGDKLILPRCDDNAQPVPMDRHNIVNHAGKHLRFPDYVTADFAKLMGFLIGDGWLPKAQPNVLCWAEGEHEEINNKYKEIISSFGYEGEPVRDCRGGKKYGYFTYYSGELARTVANMGLVGRCWEKRIPDWVFVASHDIKLAFIEGLVDSDGSTYVDRWNCERFQLEATSEELIKDLKVLLDQMGIKCGNVSKRSRLDMSVEFDGIEYERRESWILYWYNAKMPLGHLAHRGRRWSKYLNDESGFLVEQIQSIEDGGEIEVGDIQVESEYHNFIADGVVIHNSILDGGRKAFKQLRLMEDAALIYRITRAPEKRKFTIPVGNIPPKEVPEYLQMIARNFKRQRFYNPTTGSFDERYSPLIQEDDFFLPRRADGSGPDVETLPGGENMDKIQDIEYFKKKMIAPMKIPFARVGIGEGAGEANEKSLSQSSSEFAKSVQWIQREVSSGLTKVAIVHLALRGFGADDLKGFTINCTANSAMEELYRIEAWQTRVSVMSDIKGLGWFPKDWIVSHFTDLSPDEIQEIDEYAANEEEGGGGGGMGGGGGGGGGPLGDLGAGLDLGGAGGEEGGELGGLGDLGDLGGGPEGGAEGGPEGGAELGGAEGGAELGGASEEEAPASMENRIRGFDYAAEERVINEMRKTKLKERRREILELWRKKRGDTVGDDSIVNNFHTLMESKELEGLSKLGLGESDEYGYTKPEGEFIFKTTLKEDVIREVIKENYDIIVNKDETVVSGGDTIISEADLPKG